MLLLASMATAVVYTIGWVLFFSIMQPQAQIELPAAPFVLLILLVVWGSATLWYHCVYLFQQYRAQKEAIQQESYAGVSKPQSELHVVHDVVVYDNTFWGFFRIFFIALAKLLWVAFKYIGLPILPLILIDYIRRIPIVGTVLGNVLILALPIYPVVGILIYVGKRRHEGSN